MSQPTRPFLRKGQGIARFNMAPSQKMRSSTSYEPLPRFTPSCSAAIPPTSARTDGDSGISNEAFEERDDETRPPTMASLPLDGGPSPCSSRREPSVLEEQDLEKPDDEEEDEEGQIESISASRDPEPVPFFVADCSDAPQKTAPSTITSTNSSVISSRAKQDREMVEQMARNASDWHSVSTFSPTTSSSVFSAPQGASTPINNSDFPLETPQPQNRRALKTTRPNLETHDAQTGASLIQRPPLSTINEKRNEHIYDLPRRAIANNSASPRKGYTGNLERNLMIQLRDAIAHVDFADEQLRKQAIHLKKDYADMCRKHREEFEARKRGLEEEFERKFERIEEENRIERDRMLRERRDIERDRRVLQKGTNERHLEQQKLVEQLRGKLSDAETQMAKMRTELRNREEKMKKKEEEAEKARKELERARKNSQTMEKQLRQMRNEREKREKEEEMFAKAEMNRRNRTIRVTKPAAIPETQPENTAKRRERGRSVSWANDDELLEEKTIEPRNSTTEMTPIERGTCEIGPFVVYRDHCSQQVTRMTRTAENSLLFEYLNGDKRWMNARKSVVMYYFAIDGTVAIDLVESQIYLRFYVNRQMEIHRPNNNITLISCQRNEIRTELMSQDGYSLVEIFDRNGTFLTRDSIRPDLIREYAPGQRHSLRDPNRYVTVIDLDDFEFVEPEYRMRWFKGEKISIKLGIQDKSSKRIFRVDIDAKSGDGLVEAVDRQLAPNRVAQKQTVFEWCGPTKTL